jgi:GNAT superfamily N-acetyltransferase
MLRFQRFKPENICALTKTFSSIFDSSELEYFEDYQYNELSFIGVDRVGAIQAFIMIRRTPNDLAEYEITYLGVAHRYRSKGYAKRLIELVKDVVGKGGVWLNVLDSNTIACSLYNKMGFEEAKRFSTETKEMGIMFVCGIRCWHCDTSLGTHDVILENYPVKIVYTENGFRQIEERIRVCRNCRTRVVP